MSSKRVPLAFYLVTLLVVFISGGPVPSVRLLSQGTRPPVPAKSKPAQPTSDARKANDTGPPLSFQPNLGQSDPNARFLARGSGYGVFLTANGGALALRQPQQAQKKKADLRRLQADQSEEVSFQVLSWEFLRSNPKPKMAGLNKLSFKTNYLGSNDRKRWRTNVPNYADVQIGELYKGIDLVYRGQSKTLEYQFLIAPKADPSMIRLSLTGPSNISLNDKGDLLLKLQGGQLMQTKPIAYQETRGIRTGVEARYILTEGEVRFVLGDYDRTRPLVIDPTIDLAMYIGTSATDQAYGIAMDSRGNIYVTGSTTWPGFALTGVLVAPLYIFVWKINSTGDGVYLTLIGEGSGTGLKVTPAEKVYVVGSTWRSGIPITPGVSGPAYRGGVRDGFACVLNESGTDVVYSTYLGGTDEDYANGLDVDALGNAYVVGTTYSADFPGAATRGLHGRSDAFLTKVDTSGRFEYSNLIGGSREDDGNAIVLDDENSIYLAGGAATDFPTTPGAYRTTYWPGEPGGGFVMKLREVSSPIYAAPLDPIVDYSTLIGEAPVKAIAVHDRTTYVTGRTFDPGYPVTPGAFSRVYTTIMGTGWLPYDFCGEAFVTRLNATGSALIYSTFLGGLGDDGGDGISVDSRGQAYVVGHTDLYPPLFPTTWDAFQRPQGLYDAFLTVLSADGSRLVYSTIVGTPDNNDFGTAVTLSDLRLLGRRVYVTGYTHGSPARLEALCRPRCSSGPDDIFIIRFNF